MLMQANSPQRCTEPPVPDKLPAGLVHRPAAWERAGDVHCLTVEVCIAKHILVHHLQLVHFLSCQLSVSSFL